MNVMKIRIMFKELITAYDTKSSKNKCIHEKFIFRIKCSLLTMTWLVILNRNNNTNNHNCYLQGRLYTMRNFHNLCSISTYNWGVANFIMFINDDFPIAGDRFNHISWDYKIHKTIQQLKWGDLKVKRYPQKIVKLQSFLVKLVLVHWLIWIYFGNLDI